MPAAAKPLDDRQRVAILRALHILDTSPEERFDRITRLAQRLFGTPMAAVTLIDADRQWFKSALGMDGTETTRDVAFCAHAILDSRTLVVPDATEDERFSDNPQVIEDPGIRFYAGCPITAPGGARLGTLCVIDRSPRSFSSDDVAALEDLARMVESEIAAVHLATIDELTGIANRRAFVAQSRIVLALCRRREIPATLLFLDIERFKAINDTFGHDEGDRAIAAAARLLEGTFRSSDIVGRLGGDEFAVLATGTAAENIHSAISRLRASAARHVPVGGADYRISFSVGAQRLDHAEPLDIEDMLARADEAMYSDKRSRQAG